MKIINASFEAVENNSRIKPIGIEASPTITNKVGIKSYYTIVGVFLFLFGFASRLEDASGKIWYVNKSSLRGWGSANSGEKDFRLRNLDKLLQDMKNRSKPEKPSPLKSETPIVNPSQTKPSVKIPSTSNKANVPSEPKLPEKSLPKPKMPYDEERIGQELWLRTGQLVSKDTVKRVNTVADYLDIKGFELVGAEADGNCYFDSFIKSLGFSSRKIPIIQMQDNPLAYLRSFLSGLMENTASERAKEIKQDKELITAIEGDRLAIAFKIAIRVVTPNEEGGIDDLVTYPDPNQDAEVWNDQFKPRDYILIVDLGGHFVTAKPKS